MQTVQKSSTKRFAFAAMIGIVSLIIGVWLSQKLLIKNNDTRIPPNLYATVLDKARPLMSFNLLDHNKQDFSPEQLKGHWSFLFFGFTNCPDVCPTTLKIMRSVWKTLPTTAQDKGHPKFYFISVDPERDTPKLLKPYVQFFNPEFIGVTGKLDELDKLTNQIGVHYGYDEKADSKDTEYIVNHSAQLILVDPKGRMRAVISPPYEAKVIAANFQTIRVFYGDE